MGITWCFICECDRCHKKTDPFPRSDMGGDKTKGWTVGEKKYAGLLVESYCPSCSKELRGIVSEEPQIDIDGVRRKVSFLHRIVHREEGILGSVGSITDTVIELHDLLKQGVGGE